MGLGKYIFGSLVLIIAVASFTHFGLGLGDYRFEYQGFVVLLPIAAWIVLTAVVLWVLTIFHLLYYGFKGYLFKRSINKDEMNLFRFIKDKLESKETKYGFKNKSFEEVAEVIAQSNLCITKEEFETSNKALNEAVKQINKIKSGVYVTAKEYKIVADAQLEEQNTSNRIAANGEFYLDVLGKPSLYSKELVVQAFEKLLEEKSITTIKKYMNDIELNDQMILNIFKKDAIKQEDFSLTNSEILKLMDKANFTKEQYLEFSNAYKTTMLPDRLIQIFEELVAKDDDVMDAYLYTLFEFEMIDEIRDLLITSNKNEYTPFKALLDLKDSGKHYTLDMISYK
ncbi:MAG: hypothetical protein U9N30_07805 [Campylobacterota bacterium]|nr:hypothetical protein [Campylobacterota bacterium]